MARRDPGRPCGREHSNSEGGKRRREGSQQREPLLLAAPEIHQKTSSSRHTGGPLCRTSPPLPRGLFCSLESCLQGRPGPHQYRGTSWALCRWSPLSFLSAAVPCPWPLECTPGGHESLRASSGQLNPTSAIKYPHTRGAGDEKRLSTFFLSFFRVRLDISPRHLTCDHEFIAGGCGDSG